MFLQSQQQGKITSLGSNYDYGVGYGPSFRFSHDLFS